MVKRMNKIEKLIDELCPEGVEFRELGKVANSITTGKLNANAKKEDGEYLFFTCDANPYKIDIYAFDTEAILISGNGSQVGHINYYSGKFNAYQRTYVVSDFKNIEVIYLLHYLNGNLRKYIFENSRKGSVPYITMPMLESFQIPIPPLAIQQEIVKILDNFTKLEAELEAELEARKKQYEYYRDELLTFGDEFELKELETICEKTSNVKWSDNGNKEFQYIDLSSVDRNMNCITETKVITSKTAPSRAQQIVRTGDIIFGTTRPTLKRFCVINEEYNEQICSTGFCVFRPKTDFVLTNFIFYFISSSDFFAYTELNQKGASYPAISDSVVKKYKIPVPSIPEQKRIVAILDKFDALANDISVGLPAELNARRKQYEYYRDKILTFKEVKADV